MRRALALRSLLGRVVHSAAASEGRRCIATTRAQQQPALLQLLRAANAAQLRASSPCLLLPPLAASSALQQQARHNHCSCPTLRDDSEGPPRVRVAYDPADVDAFIAVADAIEDAFPDAVVEGHDGDEEQGEVGEQAEAAACGISGAPGAAAAAAAAPVVAFPTGGPGCEFTVTLPNGAVAFRARAAPRDAAAVLAAIRAAGGEGMLGAGEE